MLHVHIQAAEARRADAAAKLSGPEGYGRWRALHAQVAGRVNTLVAHVCALYALGPRGAPVSLAELPSHALAASGAVKQQQVHHGGSPARHGHTRPPAPNPGRAPAAHRTHAPQASCLHGGGSGAGGPSDPGSGVLPLEAALDTGWWAVGGGTEGAHLGGRELAGSAGDSEDECASVTRCVRAAAAAADPCPRSPLRKQLLTRWTLCTP